MKSSGPLLGFWLAMRGMGRVERRVARAAALGTLSGLPSLAFAGLALVRDYPTRQLARVVPQIPGEQSVATMAREIGYTTVNALGAPLLVVITFIVVAAIMRRDRLVVAPIAGATAAAAGMLALVVSARLLPITSCPSCRSCRWGWRSSNCCTELDRTSVRRLLHCSQER